MLRQQKRSFRRCWSGSSRGEQGNATPLCLSSHFFYASGGRLFACLRKLLIEFSRHPPRLVPGQPVGRRAALGLVVKVEIGERLPRGVADDEASGRALIDETTMGLRARSGWPSRGYRPRGFRW